MCTQRVAVARLPARDFGGAGVTRMIYTLFDNHLFDETHHIWD
jgi:hypothetical protein